ncbi:MAG: mechanosensitive ion channel family protein [Chloroflexi bacterium]|nr:mechanosensitive ion channel family protein [Chloroflexota bacterium]
MGDNFFHTILGNPADGSFLDWAADGGIWALLIALGAVLGWWFVRRAMRRGLKQAIRGLDQHEATADVGMAVQAADSWVTTFLLAGVFVAVAALSILWVLGNNIDPAIDYLKTVGKSIGTWLATDGLRILLILFLSWVATRVSRRVIPRVLSSVMLGQASTADHDEILKRSQTLSSVFVGAVVALIYILALFTVLSVLAVPIGPVIGGFGIAGIAVGFGAQHLVRDLISGVFILAENQYRTGDVVTIAGVSGLVESINLRRTVLRDLDGQVHVIPNGEITVAANKTKYWSRINLDIGVAYKEDVVRVREVLNDVGNEIAGDPYYGLMLITPPQVLRLNSFDDSAVTFKMLGDCKPMKQWEIMGEMRKRIKIRFDAEGIEIPFPHQTIYWGEAQPPFRTDHTPAQMASVVGPPETTGQPRDADQVQTRVTTPVQPEGVAPGLPGGGSELSIPITPAMREEMLAVIAMATQARMSDVGSSTRSRSLLMETADND